MSSAGRISISSYFQHGLQDGYLSLKPHVKGGLFPLKATWSVSALFIQPVDSRSIRTLGRFGNIPKH